MHPELTAPKVAEAAETPSRELTSLSSKEDFVAYIEKEAPTYGLSAAKLIAVVDCETGGTWDPNIEGDKHTSFGLSQLHDPASKGLTIAQAKTPKIALDYLLKHWYTDTWTCQHGHK